MKFKGILIVITNHAFVVNQLNWALALELTDWFPLVYSTIKKDELSQIIKDKNLREPKNLIVRNFHHVNLLRISKKIISIFNLFFILKFFAYTFSVIIEIINSVLVINEVRNLLRKYKLSAVLLSESSPAYMAPEILFSAKKEKVSSFTHSPERDCPSSYAMIYKSDSTLYPSGIDGWAIKKYYKKWIIRYEAFDLFRCHTHIIFSQEILGIAPKNPWHNMGFEEDVMLVNNNIQKLFYENNGVNYEKIKLIGSPIFDYLYVSKKIKNAEVLESLKFNNIKPNILCCLPQTHWIAGRFEAEFQDHEEMINAWIKILNSQNTYNIIISLHPSMKYENYIYLENDSLKVSSRSIWELLPLSAIFIASISSTIPMAISLGIPVINYDVYRYSVEQDYLRFNDGSGTVTVLNQDDFRDYFFKLTSDNKFYETTKKLQEQSSSSWGILDGKCMTRFLNIIENTIYNE